MKNKLAMWSWILPIIGLFLSFGISYFVGRFGFYLMLVAGILGLVFGIIALRKISKGSKLKGRGQAITGIVLNILVILYWIFTFVDVFFWEIY